MGCRPEQSSIGIDENILKRTCILIYEVIENILDFITIDFNAKYSFQGGASDAKLYKDGYQDDLHKNT